MKQYTLARLISTNNYQILYHTFRSEKVLSQSPVVKVQFLLAPTRAKDAFDIKPQMSSNTLQAAINSTKV